MYDDGKGVPLDYMEACAWLRLAIANGIEMAKWKLEIVTNQMTKEQIAEAESCTIEIQNRTKANNKD